MSSQSHPAEWWLDKYNEICADPRFMMGEAATRLLHCLMVELQGAPIKPDELAERFYDGNKVTLASAVARLRTKLATRHHAQFKITERNYRVVEVPPHEEQTEGRTPSTLPRRSGTERVTLSPLNQEIQVPLPHDSSVAGLNTYAGEWHLYHLTRNATKEFWSYKKLRFEFEEPNYQYAGPAHLVASAATLDVGMPDEARDQHEYRSELSVFGGNILIQTVRTKGDPDIAIEVFRDVGPSNAGYSLYGMKTISHSWEGNPLMTISIMSRKELDCTRSPQGEWPKDGHPIVDENIKTALENEWNSWALRPSFERLGTGIISDNQLLQVERRTAQIGSKNIWVASHNLQNVGEVTSPYAELVRQAVISNAGCGITYSYIFPERGPGEDRIKILEECFKGRMDQLTLHPVREKQFAEITLLPAHFIIFNPKDEEVTAYMQLPLPTAQKGWIKLDTASARRVRDVTRRLMERCPDKRQP